MYTMVKENDSLAAGAACGILALEGGPVASLVAAASCAIIIANAFDAVGPPPEGSQLHSALSASSLGVSVDATNTYVIALGSAQAGG